MWKDVRDILIFWWTFDAAILIGSVMRPEAANDTWPEVLIFAVALFGTVPAFLCLLWLAFAMCGRLSAKPVSR